MVIVVGAGLAGLVCSLELHKRNIPYLLLEASKRFGGRVGSLEQDHFKLDLGFQVLLDSYSTVLEYCRLEDLQPRFFDSGAIIWNSGKRLRFRSRPPEASVLTTKAFSWKDKLRLASLSANVLCRSDQQILAQNDGTAVADCFAKFSEKAIEGFFRPFFGGVLLDNDLQSSSVLFRYYFKKFLIGRALIPASGMQEIPDQLSKKLDPNRIRLQAEVTSLRTRDEQVRELELSTGELIECEKLVLACSEPVSGKLLGGKAMPEGQVRPGRCVSVIYWASKISLYPDKLLVLLVGRKRLIRHFVQITNVAPELAPAGVHLISATILGEPDRPGLVADAESEICEVFSEARGELEFLRTIQIPYGVPLQPPGRLYSELYRKPYRNVWLAGDQISHASMEGVTRSGAAVAHDIARTF